MTDSINPQGSTNNGDLFIPNKSQMSQFDSIKYGTDMRAIERWANSLIAQGLRYASLTGPGETATPGDLTQKGGFDVQIPVGDTFGFDVKDLGGGGFNVDTNGGVSIKDTSPGGYNILEAGTGPIDIQSGTGGISIAPGAGGIRITLPAAPGAPGTLWNNAGVVTVA